MLKRISFKLVMNVLSVFIPVFFCFEIYTLTHKFLFDGTQHTEEKKKETKHYNIWSIKKSVIIILISTVFVVFYCI